jgi:hypothetical protein
VSGKNPFHPVSQPAYPRLQPAGSFRECDKDHQAAYTGKQEKIPAPERLTSTLAEHFGIPEGKIAAALSHMHLV